MKEIKTFLTILFRDFLRENFDTKSNDTLKFSRDGQIRSSYRLEEKRILKIRDSTE